MNAIAAHQKLVLIVDDLEDNRILLDRALKSSGYITMQAQSGQEALAMIAARQPDMVLLDWMMPQLTGLETLRAIRDLYSASRMPVIMCTAIGEEDAIVTAISAGANDYMVKPISLPILRARMAQHLQQRAVIDTLDNEKSLAERKLTEQRREMFRVMAAGLDSTDQHVMGDQHVIGDQQRLG